MGTHGKSTFEQVVKYGVPFLAVALWLGFSPRMRPRSIGPGASRWLGVTWVGPNERTVLSKEFSPEKDVIDGPQDHVLGLGPRYSPVHIDAKWEVTLQGYGPVPVDATCFDTIKVGDIWNNSWKFGCK